MRRAVFSSSTLLTEIMQRPLDPGYAAARRRREAHGPPPRRRALVMTALGVVLGLVVGAGVVELRRQPLETADRAVLEAEIERRTAVADTLAETNESLRVEIETAQEAALGERAAGVLAAADRLALPVGAVPVTGDGVVVVLDDSPDVRSGGGFGDDGRVRDGDVQTVVNGLWAAGAEAVAVNGQRLTALSTIRHAGDAIVVDLRQLARPYTIEAVGDPDTLLRELRSGRTGDYTGFLRNNYGITVQQDSARDLRLPAAARLTLRHAVGVEDTRPEGGTGEDGES